MTIGMLVANIPVQISNSSFLLCSKFLPQCRQYRQSAALCFPQEGHRAIWQSGARQNPEFEGRVIRDLGLRIGKIFVALWNGKGSNDKKSHVV